MRIRYKLSIMSCGVGTSSSSGSSISGTGSVSDLVELDFVKNCVAKFFEFDILANLFFSEFIQSDKCVV